MSTSKSDSSTRDARGRRVRAWVSRHITAPVAENKVPIILFLILLSGGLGIWGFRSVPNSNLSWWDSVYRSVQLFVLEFGAGGRLPRQLELARFLAPIIAGIATVVAVFAVFRDYFSRVRGRFARDHVLICGLGRCGSRLALGFRDRGYRVFAIERDSTVAAIETCRRQGVVILAGDAADWTLLRQAGIRRARHLVAVCGDDGLNVDITLNALELVEPSRNRPLDCFAHVVDPDLRHYLREFAIRSPKASVFRLNPFDISEAGAPRILAEYAPFDERGKTAAGAPHVGLVGLGQTGAQIVLSLAQLWTSVSIEDRERLRVTILDKRADELTHSLRLKQGRLDTRLQLTSLTVDVDSALFPDSTVMQALAGQGGVTCVYVCLDEEVRGLRTALILRRALQRVGVPIVVRTTQRSTLTNFPVDLDASQVNIRIFHMLDRVCTPEVFLRGTNELLAQAIHEAYLRHELEQGRTPETNPSIAPWEELPESLKESNRDQAAHIGTKLRAIGCDIRSVTDAHEEPALGFSASEIELLAKMEHERWMSERRAAGWTLAPTKETDQKKTPYLVPWEELSEGTREKDRIMVRGLPAFLAKAGLAIIRLEATNQEPERASGSSPHSPG